MNCDMDCEYELRTINTPEWKGHQMFCSTHNLKLELVKSNPFNENGQDWACPTSKQILASTGWQ